MATRIEIIPSVDNNLSHHIINNSNCDNDAVHIFNGNEPQPPVYTNPVIFDMNADRVRPYTENEWSNFKNTPNRQAQENYDRIQRSLESINDSQSSGDTYQKVVENALNIAFLAANTNQLRLLTENQQEATTYVACVGMVIMSLVMQILVSVSMLTISINNEQRWRKLKTIASIGVAVIAVVNIIVLTLLNTVIFK
ncbi:ninjurin-B-like [Sabethes cyaneus]|uniref:ninjurin-B-like n=1 Tax=Sabethes cyaneus TaxID=53552 RepID=UPI00237D8E1E|nr:ninjurin-B-like [Sabethes cyaneus]